jgi:hypothetical protein
VLFEDERPGVFDPARAVALGLTPGPDFGRVQRGEDVAEARKIARGRASVMAKIEKPCFAHPLRAAYVLGPERGALSPELAARCQHLVRIPAAFALNLATAGTIVMYDRLRAHGRFAAHPVAEGADALPPSPHVQGAPRRRRRQG